MRERSKKVTILRAQYALAGSEVRFPPVERSDHVKRPLDSAPGQPDPVAVLAVLVLTIAVAGCTTERTYYAEGEQSDMVEIRVIV